MHVRISAQSVLIVFVAEPATSEERLMKASVIITVAGSQAVVKSSRRIAASAAKHRDTV